LCLWLAWTLCRSIMVVFPCTDVFNNLPTRWAAVRQLKVLPLL
jgi:hypothetical protein